MSAELHDNKRKRLIFSLICAAIFADSILYAIIIPIVPGYVRILGMDPRQVGVFFALYPFTLLVLSIPAGVLSDKLGRWNIMLMGMFGLCMSSIAFGLSRTITALFISRFLQGVSAAATWTAGLALIGDLFPSNVRGGKLGFAMNAMGFGAIIGPVMGGLLYYRYGFGAPFYLSALLAFSVAIGFLMLNRPPAAEKTAQPKMAPALFSEPNLILGFVMIAVGVVCLGMFEVLTPLYLTARFKANSRMVGALFSAIALTYIFSQPFFGHLSDKYGRKIFIVTGGAITALLCLIITKAASFSVFFIAASTLGITLGMLIVCSLALINDVFDHAKWQKRYGLAAGYFNVAYSVGMIIGPLAGSMIYKTFGFRWAFLCYSAALAAGVIYTGFFVKNPRHT